MHWLFLFAAIITEIIGTSSLKESNGFTNLVPSVITIISYAVSFYCLSITIKVIPVGISYAIWSGVGIVLISLIGWFWFKQKLDTPAMIGMGFIIVGVLVINLFSSSTTIH